jgi:hypothetical protein
VPSDPRSVIHDDPRDPSRGAFLIRVIRAVIFRDPLDPRPVILHDPRDVIRVP